MRGFGFPIALTKQQPHTVYCIYAPLNAEHEYAYDAGAIVVYLRGMKNRQISHLKKTIITPFEPRYSNRPDGAVWYKRKKALDVCIVKGTAATPCRRFACLSTTKLIRYCSKSKFFTKNFQSISKSHCLEFVGRGWEQNSALLREGAGHLEYSLWRGYFTITDWVFVPVFTM